LAVLTFLCIVRTLFRPGMGASFRPVDGGGTCAGCLVQGPAAGWVGGWWGPAATDGIVLRAKVGRMVLHRGAAACEHA